ncbi:retrovirus-related pol polyprotein from transposon TNT 1-94 [Tanacetum coccineum]
MYLKKAQNEHPGLYAITQDQSDPATRLIPDREEILTLAEESRSKLNKDFVKPFATRKLNNEITELQCLYLHKVMECDCLAQKLSEQTNFFAKKGRSMYSKKNIAPNMLIQDLKAQLQDKNMAISELKKLVEKCKGKSVDTKFDKPSVVRQPNAQRIPKPSVLGKPAPFSDSLERKYFAKKKSVPKTNESEGLSKPVTLQNLPQTAMQASVTACNDSLKSRTSNVNDVCTTCGKCVFNSNHDACVSKFLNDVNARTKKPNVVPISTRKPKSQANKSVATPHKKTVASESTITSSKSYYRMLYKKTTYVGQCITRCAFVEKYLGTVHFGNDQFAPILGYGDLEVAFQKSTCFVRDLQGNDLLFGNRGSISIKISLQDTTYQLKTVSLAKASPTQAWLWHRRLSHLNFDYINLLSKKDIVFGLPKLKYVKDQLCSSCEASKAKRSSLSKRTVPSSKRRLLLLTLLASFPQRTKRRQIMKPDPAPELQNVSPSADTTVPSQQELDLLFGPLYDEFFNDGTSRVNKSSSPTDNSVPQDTHPSTNIQPTSEPSTPTNAHAEENNVDQAEFTNPFCTSVQEIAESSSRNSVALLEAVRDLLSAYAAHLSFPILPDRREKRILMVIDGGGFRSTIPKRFKFTWDSGSEGFWPLDLIAFSMPFHAVAFDIEKALLEELQFLDDNFVSWMSRKQDLIVDADTASRLGLQRQQNTIVLRFLVSIAISMTLHV